MSQNSLARLNGQALIHIFSQLEDPRVHGRCSHKLIDIIVITVCAIACGIKHWNTIEEFAKQRKTWLKRFLDLPNGIPSHQTFCRIFLLYRQKIFLTVLEFGFQRSTPQRQLTLLLLMERQSENPVTKMKVKNHYI